MGIDEVGIDKVEIDKVGIDEVGINKVGIDEVGINLSTFTEVGPQFANQDSRLGPVREKAKKLSTLQYPKSISVTSAILISKV